MGYWEFTCDTCCKRANKRHNIMGKIKVVMLWLVIGALFVFGLSGSMYYASFTIPVEVKFYWGYVQIMLTCLLLLSIPVIIALLSIFAMHKTREWWR